MSVRVRFPLPVHHVVCARCGSLFCLTSMFDRKLTPATRWQGNRESACTRKLKLNACVCVCVCSSNHSAGSGVFQHMETVGGGDESGRHEVLHQLQKWNQHHPGEPGGRCATQPLWANCAVTPGFQRDKNIQTGYKVTQNLKQRFKTTTKTT